MGDDEDLEGARPPESPCAALLETLAGRLDLPAAVLDALLAPSPGLAPPPELRAALGDAVHDLGWVGGRAAGAAANEGDLLNRLGDVLFNWSTGGFAAALHAYRASLAVAPAAAAASRGLGECLARQGRLIEAAAAHDRWFAAWLAGSDGEQLHRQQADAAVRGVPPIMLVTMQKSASEFIRDSLMQALDLPLIYATVGTIPADALIPSAIRQLGRGGALCRTHAGRVDDLSALAEAGIDRLIVHVRDPRQTTVSWTYQMAGCSRAEAVYSWPMYTPPVPDAFMSWPFERQLDWSMASYFPGQVAWIEGWLALRDGGSPVEIAISSYEDFMAMREDFFRRLLAFFGVRRVDPGSIVAAAPRMIRNFRAGALDEWRTLLTPQQRREAWRRLEPTAGRFGWTF